MELHGYESIEEFIKIQVSDLYNDPRQRLEYLQALKKQGFVKNYELHLKKKDGTEFWASCTAKIHYDKMDGALEDISERKLYEKNLEKAYNEIRNQQAQLVQSGKMSALGQLVAGVAHEINNPNCLISLNVSLLSDYWNYLTNVLLTDTHKENISLKTNKVLKDVERIISALTTGSDRIKVIIDNLKDFSREGEESRKDYYNLKEIIEKAYLICGGAIRKKVSNIVFDIPANLPPLYCNDIKIEQLLINLLTNAADAISDCTDERKGMIKVTCYNIPGDNFIEIHISDNGMGIPQEKINKIFEPFYTSKSKSGGTGLGLSIVWGIIKSHNGEINLESKEGAGTKFVVKLPIKGGAGQKPDSSC